MTSPSTLTFGKAKDSSILRIAGVCGTSPQFANQLNEAVERLMQAGEWWATVVKARVCTNRGCITWPRWVGTVLAINLSGQTRPIQNRWFEFMPISSSDCSCAGRWPSNVAVVDDGLTPVFSNVACGSAFPLAVFARLNTDLGKSMTFYGVNENGQEVMTRDLSTGVWSLGETVVFTSPQALTKASFREVTRVTKDLTTGPIDVYQYDASKNVFLDLGHYDGSETNPMYRHSTLRGGICGFGPSTCSSPGSPAAASVEILAKLQFIPVVGDTDVVQIDNIPALKLMVQAIRLEEAGDDDGAIKKQALAIKELNRQLRNKLPLDQIPIHVSSVGTALPYLHGIGQMQ